MSKRLTCGRAAYILGLACFFGATTTRVIAQDNNGLPKPTTAHEMLAKDAGTWDATIKVWMMGPDSEPGVSKGVETVTVMPGGLWVCSDFDGKVGEIPFHGKGQTGYDTRTKKIVGTWVDSMSTEIMTTEGDYDAASRTATSFAKGHDPAGNPYEAKLVVKHENDDTRVFTMHMKSDETKGQFAKMMEITYKRRSK